VSCSSTIFKSLEKSDEDKHVNQLLGPARARRKISESFYYLLKEGRRKEEKARERTSMNLNKSRADCSGKTGS